MELRARSDCVPKTAALNPLLLITGMVLALVFFVASPFALAQQNTQPAAPQPPPTQTKLPPHRRQSRALAHNCRLEPRAASTPMNGS